jgi:DNA-binding SARP family transcriptional activator/tetratricopeptide (TPR) repeat protein
VALEGISLDLRLLGPLDLVADGRSLDIGGPRVRIVLAMLALNANRVTLTDQLIDAIWSTEPPSTARAQIQMCISVLRKLFDENGRGVTIRTRQPGYVLEIGEESLDSSRFTALAASAREHAEHGRTAEAADEYRAALALWRGPALAGVPSDMAQRRATELEQRRLSAVEECIRLDLELGRHDELVGELRRLIEDHPHHERLYGFLMLALYRSGRQAEALEVGRRARKTLLDDVGIEPGRDLQDLDLAILNRDPALELPTLRTEPPAETADPRVVELPVRPRQLPASIADFTGREDYIAEIGKILTGTGAPGGPYAVPIVGIAGKGGVGKSSLAIRAAHELGPRYPDGHLYADLQPTDGEDQADRWMVRFLRALGVAGAAIPVDLEERIQLYRSRLAEKRILIVLDDPADQEQVRKLLPGSPSCGMIVTSRARLGGLSGAHWLDIGVFDVDQSMELLIKIVGRERIEAERDAAIELVGLCAGLPLALRIAGARLSSRPHWTVSRLVRRLRDETSRLDELAHSGLELRSNIALTYRGLGVEAQRLFRLFSLIDAPDVPEWPAAALLDTSEAHAERVLDQLIDAQVVDTVNYPGERLRYRFHDLIRVYARERMLEVETDAERDAALRRLLGGWLCLAETAHRLEYGGDYTIVHGNAARWQPPDRTPADIVGNPRDWWEIERRALVTKVRQAALNGQDELCWDLALAMVSMFETKSYFDDWRQTTKLGLEITVRNGNRRGEAAMRYSLGTLHMFQQRVDEAERSFDVALRLFDAVGDRHGRALVLRNAGYVHRLRGEFPQMLDKYEESLGLMRAVGDRMGEAHVLRAVAKFWIDEGDTDRARGMLDEALAICQEVNSARGEAQVRHRFAELYLVSGEIDLARQALNRVLLIVRNHGDRIGEAYALYSLGLVRFREGRLDNAETTLLHALSLARQAGERLIEGQALYTLGEIDVARGRNTRAADHLTEARRLFDELGSSVFQAKTLILLSEVHAGTGDDVLAGHDVERAARLLSGVGSKEAARLLAHLQTSRS